jgi:hypothetical protein
VPRLQRQVHEVPQLQARVVPRLHRLRLAVGAPCPPCDETRCRP